LSASVIWDNLDYFAVAAWPDGPLGGLALTLVICIISALLSAVIGLFFGVMLVMSFHWLRIMLVAVLGFFRAIPVIMLIFWFYFLLPMLFNIAAPQILTVVVALSCISGAYLAHGVAAGLYSIGAGQWAAGLALGLTRWQVLWRLIVPQALPRMMPSFINQWIALIKDTSLAYIIGVQELLYIARQVDGRETGAYSMQIYLFTGLVYFCLCLLLTAAVNRLLKRYAGRMASGNHDPARH